MIEFRNGDRAVYVGLARLDGVDNANPAKDRLKGCLLVGGVTQRHNAKRQDNALRQI